MNLVWPGRAQTSEGRNGD